LVEDDRAGTYRAVYTVRYQTAVYVLHVFQKKAKQGVSTPQRVIDLIGKRLKLAEEIHKAARKERK
jgi:phage-related protein